MRVPGYFGPKNINYGFYNSVTVVFVIKGYTVILCRCVCVE